MKQSPRTFAVDIVAEPDGKGYYTLVPALPGCFSQGKTIPEAKKNAREAIAVHLAALKRAGESIHEVETFQTTVQVAA